ncbi:hypothetical protein LTR85_005610 [Meristemomyces frigidus]|nr:hypothetical protein LTR85_005610 [Meristemomyces frigidus]
MAILQQDFEIFLAWERKVCEETGVPYTAALAADLLQQWIRIPDQEDCVAALRDVQESQRDVGAAYREAVIDDRNAIEVPRTVSQALQQIDAERVMQRGLQRVLDAQRQ